MRAPSLGAAFIFLAATALTAQDNSSNFISAMRGKAVVLQLTARVLEKQQTVAWDKTGSKTTIPGRPVEVKLVGANVVIAAQFTPYITDTGSTVLVCQGQVWIAAGEQGVVYHTSMQSFPVAYGEPIYFFPLGEAKESQTTRIEIELHLFPYTEDTPPDKPKTQSTPPASAPLPGGRTEKQAPQ